jgi:hypothetical protein
VKEVPTYHHVIPERKYQITITHDVLLDAESAQKKRIEIIKKVLCTMRFPEPTDDGRDRQPESLINDVARVIAYHWPKPEHKVDRSMINKVKKLQGLAKKLMRYEENIGSRPELTPKKQMSITMLHNSGLSSDMVRAIAIAADAEIYDKDAIPQKGRICNTTALWLAECFLEYYPLLAGREAGVHAEHDYVVTLGELFCKLKFPAKPQHYAKLAFAAAESKHALACTAEFGRTEGSQSA